MKTVNLNQIATETRNPNTLDLDKLSPRQIAKKSMMKILMPPAP